MVKQERGKLMEAARCAAVMGCGAGRVSMGLRGEAGRSAEDRENAAEFRESAVRLTS